MPNTIALAEAFLPLLDEVYKKASVTSVLDALPKRMRFVNANTVQVYQTSMNGLADYNRNDGFVAGDIEGHPIAVIIITASEKAAIDQPATIGS
jgi:hypothetical protein